MYTAPDEILIHILKLGMFSPRKLMDLRRVSCRFNDVASDNQVWRDQLAECELPTSSWAKQSLIGAYKNKLLQSQVTNLPKLLKYFFAEDSDNPRTSVLYRLPVATRLEVLKQSNSIDKLVENTGAAAQKYEDEVSRILSLNREERQEILFEKMGEDVHLVARTSGRYGSELIFFLCDDRVGIKMILEGFIKVTAENALLFAKRVYEHNITALTEFPGLLFALRENLVKFNRILVNCEDMTIFNPRGLSRLAIPWRIRSSVTNPDLYKSLFIDSGNYLDALDELVGEGFLTLSELRAINVNMQKVLAYEPNAIKLFKAGKLTLNHLQAIPNADSLRALINSEGLVSYIESGLINIDQFINLEPHILKLLGSKDCFMNVSILLKNTEDFDFVCNCDSNQCHLISEHFGVLEMSNMTYKAFEEDYGISLQSLVMIDDDALRNIDRELAEMEVPLSDDEGTEASSAAYSALFERYCELVPQAINPGLRLQR